MKLIVEKNSSGLTSAEFVEYLKTPVAKSEISTAEADELRTQLEKGFKQYPGLGISATQLGIKKRACYIKFGDDENGRELFLVNPIITERSKEGFIFHEGCLSLPKTIEKPLRTIRSSKIVVQSDNMGEMVFEINPDGDKGQVSVETMMTVIVQHEIDHLDGITIKDRVYNITRTTNNLPGRNDKIVMKSPSGELIEVKYKRANELFLKGYEVI